MTVSTADMDEMLHSSPDPLALSNENLPTPSPIRLRGPVISPRKPLIDTPGNAQVQDFYVSTPPSKRNHTSPTKSSSNHPPTSPWRIRLTVQAEQVDNKSPRGRRTHSSSKSLTESTTTITVPLKGGHDTPPAETKRSRGRPRKSLESPGRRSGTPKPKTDRRCKSMPEATEESAGPASPARVLPQKKNARSPRKSMDLNLNDSNDSRGKASTRTQSKREIESEVIMEKPSRVRSRGRRKEITPMKIASDPDAAYDEFTNVEGDSAILPLAALDTEVDGNLLGPEPDHACISTPQQVPVSGEILPFSQSSPKADQDGLFVQEKAEINKTDPTEEHQEYDTILESEGFSMVSVSSLASNSNHSGDLLKSDSKPIERGHTPVIASSPSAPPEARGSSLQSSSRHLDKSQEGTPKLARVVRAGIALQGVLSPRNGGRRLGSPFQEPKRRSTSVETNKRITQKSSPPCSTDSSASKERLDNLFSGFGAGTRRELRAGLRLGEELAKRQRVASQGPNISSDRDEDVFGRTANPRQSHLPLSDAQGSYNLKLPDSTGLNRKEVRYPSLPRTQLPTPERSDTEAEEDCMSWKESTPVRLEQPDALDTSVVQEASEIHESNRESSDIDYTMLAREAEWQREREAVSRQIEMANKSQVIVIDSDSSDDDNETSEDEEARAAYKKPAEVVADVSDIWQAEAHSADSTQAPALEGSDTLPQADTVKPRRSKLPDTWRRNAQIVSSDHNESSDADLFWEPKQSQRKAKGLRRPEQEERVIVEIQQKEARKTLVDAHQDEPSEDSYQPDESTGALIASQLNAVRVNDNNDKTIRVAQSPKRSLTRTSRSSKSEDPSQVPGQERCESALDKSNVKTKVDHAEEKPPPTGSSPVAVSNHDRQTAQEKTLHIDPVLLQLQQHPQHKVKDPKPKAGPRPPLVTNPTDEPSSWLILLTRPFLAPATNPPSVPPATKADLLLSSEPEPLSLYLPWTAAHKRALAPLYYSALLYPVGIFPFNPKSLAASYLGATVQTSAEWARRITKTDCAVADAFMIILEHRGYTPKGVSGDQVIDVTIAVRMCVEVWVSMCMRGEVLVDRAKGEKSGLRREGDRSWCRETDVNWEQCATGYFERKRAEFDGLPSWKESGFVWR